MRVLILPGYSEKNKDWAEAASKFVDGSEVFYWSHWEGKGDFSVDGEVERLVEQLKSEKEVYVLAKSVGTLVAVRLAYETGGAVKKMVLCGIPTEDLSEGRGDFDAYRRVLPDYSKEDCLIIQNKDDYHGSHASVEKFVHEINPGLSVISKDRDDHDYPFYEEFREFLVS